MNTKFKVGWIAAILILFSCDCNSKKQTVSKPEDSGVQMVLAAIEEKPFREPMSLGQELEFERTNRPAETVHAEALFAASSDAGIVYSSQQQSLGRMQKAAYCANARTDKMYYVVCEYEKATDVEEGKQITNIILKVLPKSSQHVNLKTVLSISQLDGNDDEMKKVIEMFNALKP